MTRTANVVGLGLIGGSVALALREQGWTVHGTDLDGDRVAETRLGRYQIQDGRSNIIS